MNKGVIIMAALGIVIVALLAVLFFVPGKQSQAPAIPQGPETNTSSMTITSPAFKNNEYIPKKYTCDGDPPAGGINPELLISGVPENAVSLALIMDDPDAPVGTFLHWLVWNIGADTRAIKENSVPKGAIQGLNGAKKPGYIGPCPPSGTHRYFFKLYVLNIMPLPLLTDEEPTAEIVRKTMKNYILAQAELIGLYER